MRVEANKTLTYEYKRLCSGKTWILIALCLIANILFWNIIYKDSEENYLYQEVVESYEGEANSETIEEIYDKMEYYTRVLNEHAVISEKYAKDEISDAEYERMISDYKYAKVYINGWEKLWENAKRYEQQKSGAYFFYEVSWERLVDNKVQWIFTCLLVILLIPYFYLDKSTKFWTIGESYYKYEKQERIRLYFVIFVVLILQTIWIEGELLTVMFQSSLPLPKAAACSLEAFAEVKPTISLVQVYIVQNLLLLLKRCLDVALLSECAKRSKSQMVATVIALIYLLSTNYYYVEILKYILTER